VDETKTPCASCARQIDAAAKVCPYCGADPSTGEKLDTQAILEEVFRPRRMTATENVLEYARQRQGVVIAVSALILFAVLTLLHQFVTARNASAVSAAAAVPLTEITDLSNRPPETETREMPKLDFPYDGNPKKVRTMILEQGAVTPPEVVAAQQAAQQAAAPPAPGPAAPRAQ
jgi:hypothetical protein